MFEPKKTHRPVKEPQISARHLADYMAASDVKRRSIIAGCKFQAVARVVQQNDAKLQIGKFLRSEIDVDALKNEAQKLRDRMAVDDFTRGYSPAAILLVRKV